MDNTISTPMNDNDFRGIYEYLCWHAKNNGLPSDVFHYLEVLYKDALDKKGIVNSIVDNLGGTDYEGFPTSELNFLQRVRILRSIEKKFQLEHPNENII